MSEPRVLFSGRTTLDVLYRLDNLPEEDTKVYASALQAQPGGPALNAALTHALLGGESILISAVGSGPWAAQVRAELDRHGVRLIDLAHGTAYETPLCTVLVNTAKSTRTIVNPPISQVPLRCLAGAWKAEAPQEWETAPSVVLTDGFFFAETAAFLAARRREGAVICLDGGSWKPGTDELAGMLSVAICSERFAVPGLAHTADAIFGWFAAKGVPYVAITRGARSILASDRERRFEIEVMPVESADTLGAGDVLHGAFCHFLAAGDDFETALRKASEIATRSCRAFGIQNLTIAGS